MDLARLLTDLKTDEGWRDHLYDDATGAKIVPGYKLIGHPTICWGFALDVAPFTKQEANPILAARAQDCWDELLVAASWVVLLSEPRQRALANMAYNLGVTGLLRFGTFLSLLQQERYEEAADDLKSTPWYKQVGDRGLRIVAAIKGG